MKYFIYILLLCCTLQSCALFNKTKRNTKVRNTDSVAMVLTKDLSTEISTTVIDTPITIAGDTLSFEIPINDGFLVSGYSYEFSTENTIAKIAVVDGKVKVKAKIKDKVIPVKQTTTTKRNNNLTTTATAEVKIREQQKAIERDISNNFRNMVIAVTVLVLLFIFLIFKTK